MHNKQNAWEASGQNKSAGGLVHQSKGMNLTQSKLDLENRLNETNAQLATMIKRVITVKVPAQE